MVDTFSSITRKVLLNDDIAKKIFKNEKYGKELTARIISDLLNLNYQEILNNIKPISEEIAFSSLTVTNSADIVYQTDKFIVDMEINYRRYKSKPKVLETYVFELYLGQLHTYQDYNKLKKIIQISIDAYDFVGNNEFMYTSYLMDEKSHQRVSENFTMYHFNLAYLRKIDYNIIVSGTNKLMYDLYFLICDNDKLLNTIYKGDLFMENIIKNAREIAGKEKLTLFLSEDEIMKKDEEFIRNESYEQVKISVIHNLVAKKMSLKDISEVVNLPIDEVKRIINDFKNEKE